MERSNGHRVRIKPTNALGDDTDKVGLCGHVTATAANNSLSGYCIFLRADGTGTTGKIQVSKKVSGSSMAWMDTSTQSVPLFCQGHMVQSETQDFRHVSGDGYRIRQRCTLLIVWQDAEDATAPLTSGGPAIVTRASATLPATANFDDVTLTSP